MSECTAAWRDDWGKEHECYDEPEHAGGHECGCGARVPAYLLDIAARLARAVEFVAHLDRPLTSGRLSEGTNERQGLQTLAADARRAGLLPGGGGDG